jgi:hypothetical protein
MAISPPLEIAHTVMLTTRCSAGCAHCPFSNPRLKQLWLSPEAIQKIVEQSSGSLTVLSGGEPFEHPQISTILKDLIKNNSVFRIATGGFVDVFPWINELKALLYPHGRLQGISMGTDVLSSRVNHSNWVHTWKKNLNLFFQYDIPFSLTLTIDEHLDFPWMPLREWPNFFEKTPQFIYLRHFGVMTQWKNLLQTIFPDTLLIQDDLSS